MNLAILFGSRYSLLPIALCPKHVSLVEVLWLDLSLHSWFLISQSRSSLPLNLSIQNNNIFMTYHWCSWKTRGAYKGLRLPPPLPLLKQSTKETTISWRSPPQEPTITKCWCLKDEDSQGHGLWYLASKNTTTSSYLPPLKKWETV